jgi:hypothetical protein
MHCENGRGEYLTITSTVMPSESCCLRIAHDAIIESERFWAGQSMLSILDTIAFCHVVGLLQFIAAYYKGLGDIE